MLVATFQNRLIGILRTRFSIWTMLQINLRTFSFYGVGLSAYFSVYFWTSRLLFLNSVPKLDTLTNFHPNLMILRGLTVVVVGWRWRWEVWVTLSGWNSLSVGRRFLIQFIEMHILTLSTFLQWELGCCYCFFCFVFLAYRVGIGREVLDTWF